VYTAATRAKQELVIIGDINPIWKAVRTTHTRRTGLVEKLRTRPISDDVDVEGVLVEDAEY
jgi:ATP-dependent exoDNAse (exonuclease V) alpha subunit